MYIDVCPKIFGKFVIMQTLYFYLFTVAMVAADNIDEGIELCSDIIIEFFIRVSISLL